MVSWLLFGLIAAELLVYPRRSWAYPLAVAAWPVLLAMLLYARWTGRFRLTIVRLRGR